MTQKLDSKEEMNNAVPAAFEKDDLVVVQEPRVHDLPDHHERMRMHGCLFRVYSTWVNRDGPRQHRPDDDPEWTYRRRYVLEAVRTEDRTRPVSEDRLMLATEYDGKASFWSRDDSNSHTDSWINEDQTCEVCGHEGMRVTVHRPAGVHGQTCPTCGCRWTDGAGPNPPTSERKRLEDRKENSEVVRHIGSGHVSRVMDTRKALYRRERASYTEYWLEDSSDARRVEPQRAVDIITALLEDGALEPDDLYQLLDTLGQTVVEEGTDVPAPAAVMRLANRLIDVDATFFDCILAYVDHEMDEDDADE